ncbi:glycosyltransferase family 2 protein [Synechococcus sp. BA-124 BA4]|uniref:glycosyltransferase family 2 protein n=1 Tax=Synechococcus sp. BA-124 BA4 TaxID=3110251 RepID=UPI002B212DDA|nr:glycosyltransferase family 2 protein [Synechococcus sp. BA-124 BA4]MEA5400724.1 glycosyltransferase family 2 protein [Synechococcus sp. BA-124 BA4]MEA5411762.1 glycosyltransferase family 2 protein [Synechococcus sp. BA-120 BA3]
MGILLQGPQHRYRIELSRGTEPFVQSLQVTNGLERRRLIRISSRGRKDLKLRFFHLDGDIQELRLRYQPLFSPRAHYRVARHLRTRHGLYGRVIGSNRMLSHARIWADYNALLARRRVDGQGYAAWIQQVEAPRRSRLKPSAEAWRRIRFQFWSPGALDETDWWVVLEDGDCLAPDALERMSQLLQEVPEAELIYADSDLLSAQGVRHTPNWKPAWNPDLLLTDPHYIRCFWVRADRLKEAELRLCVSGEEPTPYGLLLELSQVCLSEQIWHWPEVLSHHRPTGRGDDASASMVQRHLERHGLSPVVEARAGGGHRLFWPLQDSPVLVSVIVPTRDRLELLEPCLRSVLALVGTRLELELLVVDNGSEETSTLNFLRELETTRRAKVLRCPGPFNYSALNNSAAAVAQGQLLLLLNNDIEARNDGWLEVMAGQALREEIGCVGAQLLYPDGTLQHAGVILGIGGVAGHSHKYQPASEAGHQLRVHLTQNLSAVTGAALMIRRSLFQQLGGLDAEKLHVSYNDLDLCLRARAAGYRNLYCPEAVLVHHESKSRGAPITPEALSQWHKEREVMKQRWGFVLEADPYYHPELSLQEENFSLRLDGPAPRLRRAEPMRESR